MRVLVVTVVHHPGDARIAHREIPALLAAGHAVTFAAPFTAYGADRPVGVRALDLPRAHGRARLAALRRARALVAAEAPAHDVVLLHDPELLLAVARSVTTPVVWDVHEDTAAAVSMKSWIPGPLRPTAAAAVARLERSAERRVGLLLAEDGYATRFAGRHAVVPNTTTVPDTVPAPGTDRVVYLGSVTRARGALEMVEVGRRLAGEVGVELIGPVAADVADAVARAHAAGHVVAHGFVPNDEAVRMLDGALAGLSLLHDEPNYRHSRPTKVIEYMAHGVPVITTPLPVAVDIVESADCGIVVPFGDVDAVVGAVRELREGVGRRVALGFEGHRAARERYDWRVQGPAFVAALESFARA
ncbi:MAG: glycosyltransferase [Frankiales bacterium]|nr:glycosyltransferase [Frankiales bacterium]